MTQPPQAPPAGPGAGNGPGRSRPGPRVAGVRLRLTIGAQVFAGLLVLAGAFLLPRLSPGQPAYAYLLATAGLVAAFLVSLVAHELAHAVAARRHGSVIEEVRIGFFGGTSHAAGFEFRTPRALGQVAAAGPIANLALAAAAGGAAAGLAALGASGLPILVLTAAVWYNLALTVVNALPAAGLDGGRVVHSVAWKRSGDRARAAVAAARVGQFTGALLVAGGVALLALGYLDGIWAGLVGLVMVSTSRSWARQVLAITALAGMKVRDVMPATAPIVAPGWQSVREFLDTDRAGGADAASGNGAASANPGSAAGPAGSGHTAFPVRTFNGDIAGLVTLGQLAMVPAERRDSVRVAQVATPLSDVVTTTPDEQLSAIMSRPPIRPSTPAALHTAGHVLVLGADGAALSVLTPADFARASQVGALRAARTGA